SARASRHQASGDGSAGRRTAPGRPVRDRRAGQRRRCGIPGGASMWQSWAGDGVPHPAPDGSGGYYFPQSVIINYAIIETQDGRPIVVIGPEVSTTSDEMSPLGHPTMGACASGGGAALALTAGELEGTTLSNHSGRFGY